jgi:hypothetical protein
LVSLIAIPLARYVRWPARYVFSLAVAAIVLIGCYLSGYQRPAQHSDPIASLARVSDVARYVFAELGHPVGVRREVSPFVGVIGLGLFGYLVFRACRDFRNVAPAQKALLATMIWVLATVVGMALGRLKFGTEQALSSRYTSPTLLFWVSLIILYASLGQKTAPPGLQRSTSWTKLVTLLLLVGMVFYQAKFTRRATPQDSEIAAAALLTGVTDTEAFGMIYSHRETSLVDRTIPLRAAHASIFADAWADWLGTQLDDHLAIDSTCPGTLDSLIALGDLSHLGRKATGRIPFTFVNGSMFRIVLADASRKIIGYGVGGIDLRPASARSPKGVSERMGWQGYLSGDWSRGVSAYALEHDGSACLLAARPQ